MKSVLISIQPKWCELIASGKKTVEVRKTKPKLETPFKVYIYETKGKLRWCNKCQDTDCERPYPNCACFEGRGKVIGEFVCDSLIWVLAHPSIFAGHPLFYSQAINDACLTRDEVEKYSGGKDVYGWHISDLVIYDKPRELWEFYDDDNILPTPLKRPPQSWCYVESEGEG